jgi:hypothetical protein
MSALFRLVSGACCLRSAFSTYNDVFGLLQARGNEPLGRRGEGGKRTLIRESNPDLWARSRRTESTNKKTEETSDSRKRIADRGAGKELLMREGAWGALIEITLITPFYKTVGRML